MVAAVIDMGTNTFNLVIAKTKSNGNFMLLHRDFLPVKLGKGGIHKNVIKPEAFHRAAAVLNKFLITCREYNVEKAKAFGTSAIRNASNQSEFLEFLNRETGIDIEVISGNREAEFIYYGVKGAMKLSSEKILILDIGGGSNEFIIADSERIYWKESFDLGMARLIENFNLSIPITQKQKQEILALFDKELKKLFEAVKTYSPKKLVGCTGSFSTFLKMTRAQFHKGEQFPESYTDLISRDEFTKLKNKIAKADLESLKNMEGMDLFRVEMVPIATLFVEYILDKCQPEEIVHSSFALREGAIQHIANY